MNADTEGSQVLIDDDSETWMILGLQLIDETAHGQTTRTYPDPMR